jgi:phytoene synthase
MNHNDNGHRTGTETEKQITLEEAYTYCRQISKHHAKTFYLASMFLPKKQQKPIFAIYALLRTVDDLVDLAEVKLTNGLITSEEIQRIRSR